MIKELAYHLFGAKPSSELYNTGSLSVRTKELQLNFNKISFQENAHSIYLIRNTSTILSLGSQGQHL